MNGKSLFENMCADIDNLKKIPSIFDSVKNEKTFNKMIDSMRIVFREHLWKNLSINSKELEDRRCDKMRGMGHTIKLFFRILGNRMGVLRCYSSSKQTLI